MSYLKLLLEGRALRSVTEGPASELSQPHFETRHQQARGRDAVDDVISDTRQIGGSP